MGAYDGHKLCRQGNAGFGMQSRLCKFCSLPCWASWIHLHAGMAAMVMQIEHCAHLEDRGRHQTVQFLEEVGVLQAVLGHEQEEGMQGQHGHSAPMIHRPRQKV